MQSKKLNNDFKEFISFVFTAVGLALFFVAIATGVDGTLGIFSVGMSVLASVCITIWVHSDTDKAPVKATKENEVKVDDTEDDDYYNSLGL